MSASIPSELFSESRRVHKIGGQPSGSVQVWLGHLNSKFAPVPQPSTPQLFHYKRFAQSLLLRRLRAYSLVAA